MKKNMIKATNTVTNATVHFVVPASNTDAMCDILREANARYEVFESDHMALTDLPEEIQAEVKETLKVYNKANVCFEYNKFDVSAHTCIKSHYNHDHFFCGTYYAADVYTKEERKQHLAELNSYDFPEWAW